MTLYKQAEVDFTDYQKEIVKVWSDDIIDDDGEFLTPSPAFEFYPHPDGKRVLCLERFIYTVAISVLSEPFYRERRWCYKSYGEALSEYMDWIVNNFEGEPKNYVKAK